MADPPPPIYSPEDPDDSIDSNHDSAQEPQLLIVPTVDSVNFQKGFLGAEDERAAIEGELQIKGANSDTWAKVYVRRPGIYFANLDSGLQNGLSAYTGNSLFS